LKVVVLRLAASNPGVADYVRRTYSRYLEREQRRVISFDHRFNYVWYTLNKTYHSVSGSKAYDTSFKALHEICETIREVSEQAAVPHASFGTKRSALEMLRKIGKTICSSSNDTVGNEVQKQFSHGCELQDAVYAVVKAMSKEERPQMCAIDDERSTSLKKMRELEQLAEDYCVFQRVGEVTDLL
ncbi:hypothetical protein K458DRAFT_260065, partial [Lentithecium fluviatile CBS 122367]